MAERREGTNAVTQPRVTRGMRRHSAMVRSQLLDFRLFDTVRWAFP